MPGPADPAEELVRATTLLEAERFQDAAAALRDMASRCESGERGRRSLLLLATLELDPRNPAAEPDSAALMAARYLSLPGLPVADRALGRGVYILALERGGNPGLRPATGEDAGGLARRFSECGEPLPDRVVSLPVLPGGEQGVSMIDLAGERDSVRSRAQELETENWRLRARVSELEAELERIRRILRARPDTTELPPSRPRR